MKVTKLTLGICAVAAMITTQVGTAQPCDDHAPFHRHSRPKLSVMLTHMLNLTEEQQSQVKTSVAQVQPRLDAIRKQAHDAEEPILKELHSQIRPLLTPEQQKRFDAFETLRETRRQPGAE